MSITSKSILLLKSEASGGPCDDYEALLSANNFEVMLVKTLIFKYENLKNFAKKLEKPDDYAGLIFSSPRCVNATQQALCGNTLDGKWGLKKNYAVGEKTHSDVLNRLGIDCEGKEAGNAKNLSEIIIKASDKQLYTRPFLFPHGNLKTDTLQFELAKVKLQIAGVQVYQTLPNPNLSSELKQVTQGFTKIPEFIAFFSPSGLHSSLPHLRRLPINLDLIKLIAIGPVTQLALEENQLRVFSTAKSPTPQQLLNTIT